MTSVALGLVLDASTNSLSGGVALCLGDVEQRAQRLVLSCTAGIGGTTMLWSGELCGCEDVARV